MHELETLKKHHVEFLAMIQEIRQMLDGKDIDSVADDVMELISQLNAELMVHLTMEDRHVYPSLLASENSEVRKVASQFKNEIGGLFRAFQDYRLKWPCVEQVILDPDGFLEDTENIFSVINKRMTMEDNLLYPEVTALLTV